jgi:hypothetical protein
MDTEEINVLLYDNLNKQNFWNDLKIKCPNAVAHFCIWIDQYKLVTDWNKLFNEKTIPPPINGYSDIVLKAPKFHDLPVEMQLGILIRYFHSVGIANVKYERLFLYTGLSVMHIFSHLELIHLNEEITKKSERI